jgi:alpha-tubulin suppressor-like RCC1 family protein
VLNYASPSLQVSRKGFIGPWPLAVTVTHATTGELLSDFPVTFVAGTSGGEFLADPTEVAGAASLEVHTDANGVARAWFKLTAGLNARVGVASRVYLGSGAVQELVFRITPVVESAELAAGTDQSLWLDDMGIARAWGRNIAGQLGDGSFVARSQMQRLATVATPLKSVAFGPAHGLAAGTLGQLYVWGDDYFGQLGDDHFVLRRAPASLGGPSSVVQVAAGDSHSLALCADGTVWAWGGNQSGQLGDGTYTNHPTPQPVAGLADIVRVVAGARYSAALAADGTVWVWGANDFGQLGVTGVSARAAPAAISGLNHIVTLASGRQHVLALRSDGAVLAWGDNHAGQLGIENIHGVATPQLVAALPASVGLSAGSNHTLALGADGVLRAWGANESGQLGTGDTTASAVPVTLSLTNVRAFAAGADHVVVLHTNGSLQGWGLNTYGQLGVPAGPPTSSAVQVSPPTD